MKNIDKLRALSAYKLAKFIAEMDAHICPCCLYYNAADYCEVQANDKRTCDRGRELWLSQNCKGDDLHA